MLSELSRLYAAVRETVRPARRGAIEGPRGPILYERDALGYPRIQARDLLDGTFARGYLHALDRLVQVQLSLVGARGRFMELLGDKPFARTLDRATRTLNLVGGLDEQVAAMRDETRALLHAYSDGFNAGVAARVRPPTLALAGVAVELLTPAVLVLLYRFLSYFGFSSQQHVAEVVVAELLAAGAPPAGLEMLLGEGARDVDPAALGALRLDDLFRVLAPPVPAGSNAFAVNGRHTASGGALLMGELHLEIGRIPPMAYAAHVDHADGSYYQGIGVPGVAWLSTGRTQHVGWSYTFGHADNFDVLVERCRGGCFCAAGQWLPLTPRVERVKVKGKPDERWVFYDGAYGTVVGDALSDGCYPCVRWSGLDQNHRDFDAARAMLEAESVEAFAETQRGIRSFSLCAVMADDKGRVGQIHTGQVDTRPEGWRGLTPWPGWELAPAARSPRPRPERERPLQLDPDEGFVAAANERAEGPDGACWINLPEPAYRHQRLRELVAGLLARPDPPELADLVQISYDTVDLCARRMLAAWGPHLPRDAAAEALLAWAAGGAASDTEEERRQMGLFHALHHEAARALLEPQLGAESTGRILDGMSLMLTFQHHLDAVLALQRPHLLDAAGLKRILAFAWPAAQARIEAGRWWAPVRTRFKNVITEGNEPTWLGLSSPPLDFPGAPTALFQARVVEFDGARMVGGPVNHLVFDMSRPGGWYNMAGGASESPLGPGYGEGYAEWLAGRFLPLGPPVGPPPERG